MSTANIEDAIKSCPLKPNILESELAHVIQEFEHLSTVDNFNRVASKVQPISATADELVCELIIDAEHVNTKGTLHGGFSASLVDICTARAVGVTVKDKGLASVELSVSYLLPVKKGEKVQIIARVLKIGRNLAFTDMEIRREDGKIAVKGKHTLAILPKDPPVTACGRFVQY